MAIVANETTAAQIVQANLPPGAELMTVGRTQPRPAVYAADLDRDGAMELAAVYKLNGEMYVTILKKGWNAWMPAATAKGQGYAVTDLTAAPIVYPGLNNLIVGWQVGAIWSKLSVYEWTRDGLKDIAPSDLYYSFMEVEHMPGGAKRGTSEIALWIHDTGEAYKVEVIRWQNGGFVPAPDVYPYYFQKVARYYERMTRQHPDYPFYWYYLADAQFKAGQKKGALWSVKKALSFDQPYPSREALLELQRQIETMHRSIALFPASLRTTDGVKWGFIDSSGKMAIPARFDYAFDFQNNGLAVVQIGGHSGLIDTNGHFAVQPVYASISPFSEGRAVVIDRQGFKLMDEAGRIVTGKAYSYIAPLSDGRAMFYVMGSDNVSHYGYLDADGHEVIPARFLEAGDFSNGKAVVKIKDNEYALIDRNGRRLATYPFAFVGGLGDGLLPFQQVANGKYGYIDEKGAVVIQPAYSGAQPFQEGRAVVNTAEDYNFIYGLIDKQGRFIVKPEYNDIRMLGEQRIALGKAIDPKQPFIGSVFAIADTNGHLLTAHRYYDVSDFHNGLASVHDRQHTFFIDRSGKAAPGYPTLQGTGSLKLVDKSVIQANIDQRLSYLTPDGKLIWMQNTVIPLRPPYRVEEHKYNPNKDYLVYYPQVAGMQDTKAQAKVNEQLKELSGVKPVPAKTQLEYSYTGDFEVAFFQKDLLVLQLTGYNFPFGAAHGMPSKKYVHINLTNGHMYQLKDLFKPGSDYVKVLSDIIGRQIKEDPQYDYVFPDTYKGITPNQPFFVTEHALHIYFEPYEIAPYAAGFPTFTIPFQEIMNIIATDGEFWRSFH
ncbi:WG repeat-containing protein [Paenibacillus thalictri]|uniref:DUF3298 domain-containing protein n=1 Tax=Paenibacillus thalictri TaxID=2527873 RepID=A0A4Q9DL14_9BACL|nr:WG repeat-containing protein [Paenibacillus thalictri]TBL72477.1 DUF3298 domain-containing protein [Paenibacillus thalictri]